MDNNRKVKKVGIMGGTFDPVHFGHLVTAEFVREEFKLDKVVFVPSGKPPHKEEKNISLAKHRYLMTILATTTNPFLEVNDTEIMRPGYSYTVDTIAQFQMEYGKETDLYFITGADAMLEILFWRNFEKLISMCIFVAATRPGFDLAPLDKQLEVFPPSTKGKFLKFEVPALSISSTGIRKRVVQGKTIKYLLPEAVEQYIYKNNLYRE